MPQWLFFGTVLAITTTSVLATATPIPSPGDYECRVDDGYRFRPCTVSVDEHGVTHVRASDGLVSVEGSLTPVADSKTTVYFDGKLSGERPFGCFSCQARCSEPGSTCGCSEIPAAGSKACLAQPMSAILKKKGKAWSGLLPQKVYAVIYEKLKPGQKPQDRAVVGYTYEIHLHQFDIRPRRR